MVNTGLSGLQFCCASCGKTHRAKPGQGGTVILCRGCGEMVRVPRSMPAQEIRKEDQSLINPIATQRSLQGVRLLRICLLITTIQILFVFAVYSVWAATLGLPKLWLRDGGDYRNYFYALWMFDLGLVAAVSIYKWLGYQRCELGADAVNSMPQLTLARFSVMLRGLGYGLIAIPWLTTNSVDTTPWSLQAVVQAGYVAFTVGIVLECFILVVWLKLLSELSPHAERTLTRYIAWLAALLLTALSAFSVVGMSIFTAVRSQTQSQGHAPVRIDFQTLPTQSWNLIAGLSLFLLVLVLLAIWQYDRVLCQVRQALRDHSSLA